MNNHRLDASSIVSIPARMRRHIYATRHQYVGLAAIFLGVVLGLSAAVANLGISRAANASSLTVITIYPSGDRFYNYDFTSPSGYSWNVDWGMNMLFWSGANIGKVKAIYTNSPNYLLTAPNASQMNAELDDGLGWTWDVDNGVKYPLCPSWQSTSPHMRVYAIPGQDYMYNDSWGFYVLGTTHRDWQECWSQTEYGWSEDMEAQFIAWAQAAGKSTSSNFMNWNNAQSGWEGNHFWQQSGSASAVMVP